MPRPPPSRVWVLFALIVIFQIVIHRTTSSYGSPSVLARRLSARDLGLVGSSTSHSEYDTAGHTSLPFSLPYDEWYATLPAQLRPLLILGLLLILAFLFSFIGITASDFFCPNLSTIATYLGLNESTAGVTFLAFGNGSPDVFSTFAALQNNTFGLAVGELLGAASFIVSIVVGSIALIRPFHVPRVAFIRDISFFTAAVLLVITVLHDGHLSVYESSGMVLLYLAYVTTVVVGNWISRRRRYKEAVKAVRRPSTPLRSGQVSPTHIQTPQLGLPSPALPEEEEHVAAPRSLPQLPADVRTSMDTLSPATHFRPTHSRSVSHALHHLSPLPETEFVDTPRANFSLLGAIEFRDVVNNLRREGPRSPGASPARSPMKDGGADYFGAAVNAHRRSVSQGRQLLARRETEVGGRRRASTHVGGHSNLAETVSAPSTEFLSPDPFAPAAAPVPASSETNPWSDQTGHSSMLHLQVPAASPTRPDRPRVIIPRKPTAPPVRSIEDEPPVIAVTDPSGERHAASTPQSPLLPPGSSETRFRFRHRTRMVLRTLFPSLQAFWEKSYLGMFLAVTSVPAILALTLTLPVIDDGRGDEGAIALPEGEGEPLGVDPESGPASQHLSPDSAFRRRHYEHYQPSEDDDDRPVSPILGEELHHLVDGGFAAMRSPIGRKHAAVSRRLSHQPSFRHSTHHTPPAVDDIFSPVQDPVELFKEEELIEAFEEEEALAFHKALVAAQCVFGPTFCCLIVFRDFDSFPWIITGTAIAGLAGATLVMLYASDGTSQPWRLVRCFCGFVCSAVWIAAIADEVVAVLGTLGEMLGLSDAIIGLTIFAVGNSLADLVANVTIAHFAPAMAFAACFGGPMLNLLLGIGGSGTYHMLFTPANVVKVHFSPTLWVSASGLVIMLVATAIFVPLNGYMIGRTWAMCLMSAYGVLMVANVLVEIKTGRQKGDES